MINKKGFTLIEILTYIAVLGIVVTILSSFILWAVRVNARARDVRQALNSAELSMGIIVREIKEAKSIYTPTSVFNLHPGQLSLETGKEDTIYIDFYVCDGNICIKKDFKQPVIISLSDTQVNSLVFKQIGNSVYIDLEISYKDININLRSAAVIR